MVVFVCGIGASAFVFLASKEFFQDDVQHGSLFVMIAVIMLGSAVFSVRVSRSERCLNEDIRGNRTWYDYDEIKDVEVGYQENIFRH